MTFISYAQNYEDVMLWRALKNVEKGFYIDVGANNPVIGSVTKAFYDAGWCGINIEPVAEWFDKLQEARPNDTNLKLACGTRKGQNTIYDVVGTGLSTMDKSIADKHANELDFEIKEEKVKVDSLTNICNQYANQDIHFIKIDVEGLELKVLKGLDLKKIRPWIIVVESTLPNSRQQNHKEWESILINRQYHFVYFDGLNRFYIDNKYSNLDKYFDSPPNVFDGFVLSGMASVKKITADLSAAKQKIDVLNHHSHHRWLESEQLNKELQALYNSKSWQITWPLRKLMYFLKWLFCMPVHMVLWLVSMPKRAVRSPLVKLIDFVLNRPVLSTGIRHFLIKYPRIYKKIQLLYRAHELQNRKSHSEATEQENIQPKFIQSVKKWKLGKRIDT